MVLAVLAVALEAFMVLVVLVDGIKLEGGQVTLVALEAAGSLAQVDMTLRKLAAVEAVAVVAMAQTVALAL
jgi:hypothetical protein